MANISKIKLPNGTSYDLKDTTGRKEAYLEWGGQNLVGNYAPIDAAMIPELGANRLELIQAAGITIEYSRNGGSTWTDYGATDDAKRLLFSANGYNFSIGKADSSNKATTDYQLRVTITTNLAQVYTVLNKFVFYISTNGSGICWVTIDRALKASETTFVNVVNKQNISGWSGYNIINVSGITTYGNTPGTQNSKIRFTFGCDSVSNPNYTGLVISKIMGFGGVGWIAPNTLAKYGRIYTYDANMNVTFPAQLTATKFNGTATNADKVNNLTVQTAVPANAKFTDTTYTASTTSIGSASAGTAIPADDITAWTTNTPTAVTKKTVVTSATFNTVVTGVTKKTVVTGASGATAAYANGILTITNGSFSTGDSVTVTTGASGSATTGDSVTVTAGTAASLSYTAKSIPNISVTSKTVATGITAN